MLDSVIVNHYLSWTANSYYIFVNFVVPEILQNWFWKGYLKAANTHINRFQKAAGNFIQKSAKTGQPQRLLEPL